MPLKKDVVTTPYDFADYIASADDARRTIVTAFESGDAGVINRALGAVARSQGMSALAAEVGMTRDGLYKALSPSGNPAFRTILKLMAALGYTLKPIVKSAKKSRVEPQRAALGGAKGVRRRAVQKGGGANLGRGAPRMTPSSGRGLRPSTIRSPA